MPAALAVRRLPHKGRGLVALRPYREREVILSQPPLVTWIPTRSSACAQCSAALAAGSASPCSACASVLRFCSSPCAAEHQRRYIGTFCECGHQGPAQFNGTKFPAMAAKLMVHAAMDARDAAPGTASIVSVPPSADGTDLFHLSDSHCHGLLECDRWFWLSRLCFARLHQADVDAEYHAALAWIGQRMKATPATLEQLFPLDTYVRYLGILHLNAFALFPQAKKFEQQLGTALFAIASLLNHSCLPNVELVAPLQRGHGIFVASRPIAAGEELCVAYIDTTQPVSARQEQLAFAHGFRCLCSLCKAQTML